MDFNLVLILAPSLVACAIGVLIGEAMAYNRAVTVVDTMPLSGPPPLVDMTLEAEGDSGIWERARR